MTLSKHPVKWHDERLKNMQDYLKRKNDEIGRLLIARDELQTDVMKLSRQIMFAKSKNLDAFDEHEMRMNNPNIIG